jgi:hypothetical protein
MSNPVLDKAADTIRSLSTAMTEEIAAHQKMMHLFQTDRGNYDDLLLKIRTAQAELAEKKKALAEIVSKAEKAEADHQAVCARLLADAKAQAAAIIKDAKAKVAAASASLVA